MLARICHILCELGNVHKVCPEVSIRDSSKEISVISESVYGSRSGHDNTIKHGLSMYIRTGDGPDVG